MVAEDDPVQLGLSALGSSCDVLTGKYCNPVQMPEYDPAQGAYTPQVLVHLANDEVTINTNQWTDQTSQVSRQRPSQW